MLKTILVISGCFYVLFKLEGNWRRARQLPAGHLVLSPVCAGSTCLLADTVGLKSGQPGKAVPPKAMTPTAMVSANGSIMLPHTQS